MSVAHPGANPLSEAVDGFGDGAHHVAPHGGEEVVVHGLGHVAAPDVGDGAGGGLRREEKESCYEKGFCLSLEATV